MISLVARKIYPFTRCQATTKLPEDAAGRECSEGHEGTSVP